MLAKKHKFLVVVETASRNETDLAEYARPKGLFVEQIRAWRDACMNANGGVAKEAARLNRELKDSEKERKKLERELQRKEKALAEAAALLVLSKKANAIWGIPRTRNKRLRSQGKGLFFYLCLIVDLFSRDIVGWEVWEEESEQ